MEGRWAPRLRSGGITPVFLYVSTMKDYRTKEAYVRLSPQLQRERSNIAFCETWKRHVTEQLIEVYLLPWNAWYVDWSSGKIYRSQLSTQCWKLRAACQWCHFVFAFSSGTKNWRRQIKVNWKRFKMCIWKRVKKITWVDKKTHQSQLYFLVFVFYCRRSQLPMQ